MLRNTSIQFKLSCAMALVTLAASTTYAVILLNVRQRAITEEADAKLLVAAQSAQAILGPRYHDRIRDKGSVSKEEFDRTVATFDQLCLQTGMQYIWSVMVLEGQVVFTSATHSVLTNSASDCATFLEVHTTPEVYARALATMQPEYSTFDNKWGRGRMLLIPGMDGQGRKHLFAASVRLEELSQVIHQTLVESVLLSGLIAVAAALASLPLSSVLARPLVRLSQAAQEMAHGSLRAHLPAVGSREIVLLAQSLERMRQAIHEQIQALRQSEGRFATLADRNERLVRELEHRIRNHLAGLLGLTSLMRSRARDVPSFANAMESRLTAMAHVHRLLAETRWEPVGLRGLVSSTLEVMGWMARHGHAVAVEGPELTITPAQAMPLSLVLVEWFTNSCKYGAHAVPAGSVLITWEIEGNGQGRFLRMSWQERNGPVIAQPPQPSLGSELVEGFVSRELRGRCQMSFPPAGAHHVIEFPIEAS